MSSSRLQKVLGHLTPSFTGNSGSGKTAIVVGVGPRNGLGGAIAARFAQEGYHVFIMGRTQEKMDDTKAGIEQEGGSCTTFLMKSIGASGGFQQAEHNQALMEEEVLACFGTDDF